jgi:hypothetical protein
MYDQSTSTVFEARPESSRGFDRIKKKMYRVKSCTCSQLLSNLLWDHNILLYKLITVQNKTYTMYTASRPINMLATRYWASYTLDLCMTSPKLCWQLYGIRILSLVLSPLLWRLTHGSVTVT